MSPGTFFKFGITAQNLDTHRRFVDGALAPLHGSSTPPQTITGAFVDGQRIFVTVAEWLQVAPVVLDS